MKNKLFSDTDGIIEVSKVLDADVTKDVFYKFVRDNGSLDDDVNILVLEDDGMGYGARNGYCSDIYVSENKDGKKEIQIWF